MKCWETIELSTVWRGMEKRDEKGEISLTFCVVLTFNFSNETSLNYVTLLAWI
jgi:hypothetical protein